MEKKISMSGPGPLNPLGHQKPDYTKPVQTMSGRMVHIYAIDHSLSYPVIGKISGDDEVTTWLYNGKCYESESTSSVDLVNAPE